MDKKWYLKILFSAVSFWVFVLCFCSLSFAEIIYLKSGKKVEGQIIEKTDTYIKINVYGVGLTYYWDDINHIEQEKTITDSKPEADNISKSEIIEQQQVLEFVNKCDSIIKDMNEEAANKKALLVKATLSENMEEMTTITAEMRDIIKQRKRQVLALSPPSSCDKLKSATVRWFQVNEDIHNELIKGNIQQAKLLEKQLINYLYKMKEESEYLIQYYQNKKK